MSYRLCDGNTDDISRVCGPCVHLTNTLDRQCAAFPDGIPDAIWLGKNTHRLPYPGDHGITFEAIPVRQKAVA